MTNKLYTRPFHILFRNCPDTETARKRRRHLVLSVNEWYPGVVQLMSGSDQFIENEEGVSVAAQLGVRLDQYDPNGYSESPARHGGELPDPWLIATDVLTNLNTFSENVSIFSRMNYIDPTKPMDFDATDTVEFNDDHFNEHVTTWVEIGSSDYSTPPDWVTGTASAIYHVGSKTYDAREYGGENSTVEVEETAREIVEQAVKDLVPHQIRSQNWRDRPVIQVRVPSSLDSIMDNFFGWKEWMWRNTSIQVLKVPGLGFRTPEDVYGYYEEVPSSA